MARAGTVEVILSGDMAGLDKALRRSEKALEGTASRMQSIGTRLSLGVTAPLVGLGLAAGASAISFDQAMAGVAKTVDAPAEAIAHLGEQFTELSETIPVSRNELAGIAEDAGQLGVAFENIPGFVRTIAALRVSTDLGARAADTIARLANVTGTSQTDFDRLASTITKLGANSAATEAEISEMALRMGSAGQLAGISAAETVAFAATLASAGIEAEAGGTAMQKVFLEINSAVLSGGERLEQFASIAGMTSDDFRRAFEKDAAGAIVEFVEGLNRLHQAGENVFGILGDVEFQDTRLQRAVLALATSQFKIRDALVQADREWQENTALTKEAERFYATSGNQLVTLRNRISNVAGELGAVLVPALLQAVEASEPLIGVVRSMIQLFAAAPEPIQTMVIVSGALLAIAGPLAFGLGTAASAASALSGAAALAVRGLIAMQGVLSVGGLVLSVRSFADAATLARWALASMASTVIPGGILLTGLGLLVGLLIRSKFAAMEAANELEAAKQDIAAAVGQIADPDIALRQWNEASRRVSELGTELAVARAELERMQGEVVTVTVAGGRAVQTRGPSPEEIRAQKEEVAELEHKLELEKAREAALGRQTMLLQNQRDAMRSLTTPVDTPTLTAPDAVAEAHKELATAIQAAAGMEALLGDAFDENAAKASAYRTALETLLANGVAPTDAKVREYATSLLAVEEAVRQVEEAERRRSELQSAALGIVQQSMTATQLYEQRIRMLKDALDQGFISQEQYNQAVAHLDKELAAATGSLRDTLAEQGLAAGEALIRGLISGARDMGDILKSAFINLALTYIMGPIKGILGIASPSKVFQGYGQALGDGLVVGIDSRLGAVQAAVGRLAGAARMPALAASFGGASDIAGAARRTAPIVNLPPLPPARNPVEAARDPDILRWAAEMMRELEATGAVRLGTVG